MYPSPIAIVLLPGEYEEFVKILRHDPTFPTTYEAWLEMRAREDVHYTAQKPAPTRAIVHPDDLVAYCRVIARSPSLVMLYAAAAYKTHVKREIEVENLQGT